MKTLNVILAKIIILNAIIIAFSSCNKDTNQMYNFEKEEVIEIPKSNIQLNDWVFSLFNYCNVDNIETIIVYTDDNKLAFFNISTKALYHEIQLMKDRPLHAFEYINKDSILLLYDNPHNFDTLKYVDKFKDFTYLDSLKFQLADYNGNIKKYYHFNCNKSNFIGTNYNIEQVLPPYTFLFYKTIKRIGDIVFFFPAQYGNYNFDTIENNAPFIAYYNLKTEDFVFSKHKLPNLKDKMYYPSSQDVLNFCISANGLPLLRFFYSSEIFEWDYKNDSLIKYCLKSKLIDTIPPISSPNNDVHSIVAGYSQIYYDKDNELYYSFIYLSSNIFKKNYWSIIIADKNLNYINEIVNPHISSQFAFYDKKIISYSALAKDTITIIKNKLIKENIDSKKYIDSIRNDIDKQRIEQ